MNFHDSNLFGFLKSLNLTSFECLNDWLNGKVVSGCYESPYFASFFKFEFYKENNEYFVETVYNDDKIDVCNKGGADCTYFEFIEKVNEITMTGDFNILFKKYCYNNKPMPDIIISFKYKKFIYLSCFVLTIITALLWY